MSNTGLRSQLREQAPLLGEDPDSNHDTFSKRREGRSPWKLLRRTWTTYQCPWDKASQPLLCAELIPWLTNRWILCICLGTTLILVAALQTFFVHTSGTDSEIRLRPPRKTLPGWPAKRNLAYLIHATHGAVATENKVCSDIGVSALKDGGNAVDAAIAATLCIGVVNMFSSGIGGGGFMTVRLPPVTPNTSSTGWSIDFRETAPAAANATMFVHDPKSSKFGGLSVGVPGELRGLAEAHRRWARLPWKRLVEPAACLAEGWKIGPELDRRIQAFSTLMLENPDWSAVFAPRGRLLREGEIIQRKNYARTLHMIAKRGAEAFYSGSIAQALLEKIRDTGGILTASDLVAYKPLVQPALRGSYRNRTVYTTHAPTSGPVLLHMLNLLERYNEEEGADEGVRLHRFVEVQKFGFAARTKICDPAFSNGSKLIDEVSTKEFAARIFPNITDDTTHTPKYYNPIFDVAVDHGTVRYQSHTSIVDSQGMAVAITSTVNLVFGSQVLDHVTGVILNDELDDFATPGIPNAFGLLPSPYNYPAPGKRPLSSTAPTILEHADGSFYLALGGSGGTRIFGSIARVILGADAALKHEEGGWVDISGAVELPRPHDQLYPQWVEMDSTFSSQSVDALLKRGHNVTVGDINRVAAVIQAVLVRNGSIFAASDSRKNGIAAGY